MLERAGIGIDDVGLFELNEPFAVQVLTWCDGVGVAPDDPRLNPYGGAIACGHPLAATGVRLMAQLAYGFERRPDVRYGLDRALHRARAWARRSSGRTRAMAERPVTQFHLQKLVDAGRPGRAGDDRQRRRLAQAEHVRRGRRSGRSRDVLDRLATRDWRGLVLTGKPLVFAAGADITQFPGITPERAREGGQAGPRALRAAARAAVPDARRASTARRSAAGSRSRSTATSARSPRTSATSASPRCSSGCSRPGAARSSCRASSAPSAAVKLIVDNPLKQNRLSRAAEALELGLVDHVLEPVEFLDESLELLVRRSRRARASASRRRPLRRGRGRPQGARAGRRCRPRRRLPRRTGRSS